MSRVQTFDFSVDLLKALLWQHDNAAGLLSLLRQKQRWYDENQTRFWQDWYRDVFNLDTANEFGLAIWSRILNLPLQVQTESAVRPAWGFGVNHLNFENGSFAATDGQAGLTLEQSRLALKLRYFQITSRGAVPEINEWLEGTFADQGLVYVVDNHDMTMTYFFTFEPGAQLRFLFDNFDLLPRPAGVEANLLVQVRPSWGFGPDHLNFNNGSFGA